MSIITANLKHLYQRRMNWLIAFFPVLCFVMAIIGLINSKQFFIGGPVAAMMTIGFILAISQVDILARPHAFCMPGHRAVARKIILPAGIYIILIFLIVHLFACGLTVTGSITGLLAIFSLFWLAYLLGVLLAYKTRNMGLIGMLYLPALLTNLIANINDLIINQIPYQIIISAIIMTIYILRLLGNENIARELCGKMVFGFNINPDRIAKAQKYNETERIRKGKKVLQLAEPIEFFFLAMLKAAPEHSRAKYIWGSLYKILALQLSSMLSARTWIAILLTITWFGYFGYMTNMIFLFSVIISMNIDLNVRSKMLTAGSRQDRFASALAIAISTTVLTTIFAATLCGLSCILAQFLPEFTMPKFGLVSYRPANIKLLPITLLTPIPFIMNLLFKNKIVIMMILMGCLFSIMPILMLNKSIMKTFAEFLPLLLTLLIIASWLTFIAVLKRICTKGQLS